MKSMIATGLAALVVASAAIAATGDLLPGQWEAAVTTTSSGAPHISTTKSCIEPGNSLLAELRRQTPSDCRPVRQTVSGGRIDVASMCPAGMSTITGSYSPSTMQYVLKGAMRVGARVLPMAISVKTHRVSATCSGDE